jgi:hypothetical protein
MYVYVAIWHGHMFTAILPGLSTRTICFVAGTGCRFIDVGVYCWPPGPLVRYHTLNFDAMYHEISYTEIGCNVSYDIIH